MANKNGNLFGMGSYGDNVKKEWESYKGYYVLAFTEAFDGITEKDVGIRLEYGTDLISRYLGVKKDLVYYRKKSSKTTKVSLDEVYYVKLGSASVGKLSIRVQRTFRGINLLFLYQEKRIRDAKKGDRGRNRSNHKKTKAQKAETQRDNRKNKKTL